MSSVDKLTKLAERFARKLSLAQQTSAQPGEIMAALKAAGLWEKSAEVSPMLNAAGVADDASVTITFTVDKGLNFKYHVATQPPAAAIKLANMLRVKYGAAHKAALLAAKLSVADTVDVNWMTF